MRRALAWVVFVRRLSAAADLLVCPYAVWPNDCLGLRGASAPAVCLRCCVVCNPTRHIPPLESVDYSCTALVRGTRWYSLHGTQCQAGRPAFRCNSLESFRYLANEYRDTVFDPSNGLMVGLLQFFTCIVLYG